LSSAGIAAEVASPSAQADLLTSEVTALLPVLTLAGQGAPDATETGRTAVASSLAETATPSIRDSGVQGVSALLSLAAATSLSDSGVSTEAAAAKGQGALTTTADTLTEEAASAASSVQLTSTDTALAQEAGTSSAVGGLVIFEVGAGVAVLSPVTVQGVSALDVVELGAAGEGSTLRGLSAGVLAERAITPARATLGIKTGTEATDRALALTSPTAKAAATLATLDPTLRADEAAAILGVAQASVLGDVPGRIAEIRAVLRDRITTEARLRDRIRTDARLRNELLIDTLLQD
jgi:hypothetical protein